ncbi:hypothetical protein BJ508DRAFT_412205 [Ascobolus immersus RN42]|uniref:Uncharacterized protein n=1 Tax=Ascobolus immersus RN42 TaxID=1160509 RepID=A0A3N4ILQ5_ASCIM|nr:hypothetical protein BJ508DRAFT_412205 [Ascobolus immersus RN42]
MAEYIHPTNIPSFDGHNSSGDFTGHIKSDISKDHLASDDSNAGTVHPTKTADTNGYSRCNGSNLDSTTKKNKKYILALSEDASREELQRVVDEVESKGGSVRLIMEGLVWVSCELSEELIEELRQGEWECSHLIEEFGDMGPPGKAE